MQQPESCTSSVGHVAVVRDVTSVEALFARIAAALELPQGSIAGWDDLYERLTDLSWLPAGGTTLVHASMPQLSPRDLSVYVSLLYDVIQDWQGETAGSFTAVFPESDQYVVQNIIRSLD